MKLGRDKRDAVDNMVANGTMHTTAATAWTLAAGYRPTSTQRIRAAVNVGNAISAGITTSRAVGITLTPAVNADVYFNAVVPLGTAG